MPSETPATDSAVAAPPTGGRTRAVSSCPRCVTAHTLTLLPLSNLDGWEWGLCPTTGQPVIFVRDHPDIRYALLYGRGPG